jgi:hypothetical protein
MKIVSLIAGAAVLSAVATASVAGTETPNITSARASAYFAAGTHQFYLWCDNGKDHLAYQSGLSGADARAKLRDAENAKGAARCQPVWQGRVQS